MVATSSMMPDLLDVRITKIYDNEYDMLVGQDNPVSILYGEEELKRAYDIESQIGGFGDIAQFSGSIQYDDVYQGYRTQYNKVEFAGGFKVERFLLDNDQFDVIKSKAEGLSEAAYRTQAKDAISTFTNAFTTPMPGPGGVGDGLPLCSASHTSNVPGVAVMSNRVVLPFSDTAVETVRQMFIRTRNDRGEIVSIIPDLLIVGPELEEQAYELISSVGKVNLLVNNKNFHEGKYDLYVCPWLTSSTDWFFVSTRHMKKWLKWKWGIKPEFGRDSEFDTYLRKYSVYYTRAKGWSDWRFIIGSNPV